GRQRHLAPEIPLVAFDPIEALAPAAVFVFPPAATGAGGVAGELASRHGVLRGGSEGGSPSLARILPRPRPPAPCQLTPTWAGGEPDTLCSPRGGAVDWLRETRTPF